MTQFATNELDACWSLDISEQRANIQEDAQRTRRVKAHRCIVADYCRPEVAGDVISGQRAFGVEFVPQTKFGDSSSNRLAKIQNAADGQTDMLVRRAHSMHCVHCIAGIGGLMRQSKRKFVS